MQLQGQTFLITGGASGLGAACARRFVAGGARVVIADVNAAVGEQLAAELGAAARFARTDVTDEASVEAAVATALDDGFRTPDLMRIASEDSAALKPVGTSRLTDAIVERVGTTTGVAT